MRSAKASCLILLLVGFTAIGASIIGCSGPDAKTSPDGNFPFVPEGLNIVYLANVNGELEPCGCRTNPAGGIARKWTLFVGRGIQRENSLILDAGDLFYNTAPTPPFLREQWDLQAEALAQSYATMGIDAFTPGEKDFASGKGTFLKLAQSANMPVVSANLFDRTTNKLAFDPYIVVKKRGLRFGIVGLSEETLEYADEFTVTKANAALQKFLPEVQKKSDVVIVLSHLGFERDQEIAKEFPGIRLIFGGHSQNLLMEPERIGDTLLFQTSFRSQHIGVLTKDKHELITLDDHLDAPGAAAAVNPMAKLTEETKRKIARINESVTEKIQAETPATDNGSHEVPVSKKIEEGRSRNGYSTFPQCIQCHKSQVDAYLKSPHGHSYLTLVQKKQSSNKDCLKCHTLGMNEKSGWKNVTKIVWASPGTKIGKSLEPKAFMQKVAEGKISTAGIGEDNLTRYRVYANAQCENCHGDASTHIQTHGSEKLGAVSQQMCLQCHTQVQAPQWYKNGELDSEVLKDKFDAVKSKYH